MLKIWSVKITLNICFIGSLQMLSDWSTNTVLGQKAHIFDVVYRPPDNTQSLIVWDSTQLGFLDQPTRSTASFAELSRLGLSDARIFPTAFFVGIHIASWLTKLGKESICWFSASTRALFKEFIHPDRFCKTSTEFCSMTSLRVKDRRACALIISRERRLSPHLGIWLSGGGATREWAAVGVFSCSPTPSPS